MNHPLLDKVPNALNEIKLKHLFAMRLDSVAPIVVGQTPAEFRRVGLVTGGSFESRRDGLSGKVLDGGNDWQTVRPDNTTTLDVRILLETVGASAATTTGCRQDVNRHNAPAQAAATIAFRRVSSMRVNPLDTELVQKARRIVELSTPGQIVVVRSSRGDLGGGLVQLRLVKFHNAA